MVLALASCGHGHNNNNIAQIEHGATTVRVGSHIFGARPKK